MRNLHVHILAIALALTGIIMTWAKVSYLGLPLLPNQQETTWVIEAQAEFSAVGKPVIVSLEYPQCHTGLHTSG